MSADLQTGKTEKSHAIQSLCYGAHIELTCCVFLLILLEMIRLLQWSPAEFHSTDSTFLGKLHVFSPFFCS